MPHSNLSDDEILAILKKCGNSRNRTAKAAGISDRALLSRLARIREKGRDIELSPSGARLIADRQKIVQPRFEREAVPTEALPLPELLARRKGEFSRRKAAEEARKLIRIRVRVPGPFGIHFFGDPHLDDPGCDIEAVERDCTMVRGTEGMLAANVGDTVNNWIGRLARLHGNQETTEDQGWQLAEWFFNEIAEHWIFWVAGNHCLWSGAGDPIKWITRMTETLYQPSAVRVALIAKNGREIRINCRHDFPGSSVWNPAHGPMKAFQMGYRDHIAIAGHKHKSGYGVGKDPATGIIGHCFQVAAYKVYDEYARERGFRDEHISPSVTVVIDPEASEAGLVHGFFDAAEGAAFLNFKRKRAKV